jgi:GxxExxY protein
MKTKIELCNYMNKIINYCKEVSIKLGKGYAECVYQEAICVHLRNDDIKYSKESILPILYLDINIGNVRSDIIVNKINDLENIIIECKAIDGNLKSNHIPQLICYMKLTDIKNGILVNFNQHPGKDLIEYIIAKKIDNNKIRARLSNKEYILDFSGILLEELDI